MHILEEKLANLEMELFFLFGGDKGIGCLLYAVVHKLKPFSHGNHQSLAKHRAKVCYQGILRQLGNDCQVEKVVFSVGPYPLIIWQSGSSCSTRCTRGGDNTSPPASSWRTLLNPAK
jgi:hypothetical protein